MSGPAGIANAARFNRRAHGATGSSPRVFVVDARNEDHQRAQQLFRAAGLSLQCYPSAEVFLRDIPVRPRGCLLCALELPGMDGVDLVRELRRAGQAMPAVVFAREAQVCDAVRAIRAGALEFVQCAGVDDRLVRLARRIATDQDTDL